MRGVAWREFRDCEGSLTMARPIDNSTIYVATESFGPEVNGQHITVINGETRVRAGHELLRNYPQFFKPIDVHYEVEQATSEPGVKRGEKHGGGRGA